MVLTLEGLVAALNITNKRLHHFMHLLNVCLQLAWLVKLLLAVLAGEDALTSLHLLKHGLPALLR